MPLASEINAALEAVYREPLSAGRAADVAAFIAAHRNPDDWTSLLGEPGDRAKVDYLRYRDSLLEAKDPARLARRLICDAESHEYNAERHGETADEYAAKADHRRARGETILADDYQRMADAAAACRDIATSLALTARLRADAVTAQSPTQEAA